MTLNLMLINKAGVWQSSDLRIVEPRSGRIVDDYSAKFVSMKCKDGTATLAYIGIGAVKGVHISDWVRMILRTTGEARTVDESLIFLRESATRDIAPYAKEANVPHTFNIGAFLEDRPWIVQIRNYNFLPYRGNGLRMRARTKTGAVVDRLLGPLKDEFVTVAHEVGDAGAYVAMGTAGAVTPKDYRELARLIRSGPKTEKQVVELLAGINRRASQTPAGKKMISPHCVTCFVPAAGGPVRTKVHGVTGGAKRITTPFLIFGIDVTEMMRGSRSELSSADLDAIGRESVNPRNPLQRS